MCVCVCVCVCVESGGGEEAHTQTMLDNVMLEPILLVQHWDGMCARRGDIPGGGDVGGGGYIYTSYS